MKLGDARNAYETLSGKASDIVRQVSFAGVGLIWIFKSGADSSIAFDPRLLRAAFFIFLSLLFDFLQYALGTTIWFAYFRHKEKQHTTNVPPAMCPIYTWSEGTKEKDEFLAPRQLNWPMWVLFYLKSAAMLLAFGYYIVPFLAAKFVG